METQLAEFRRGLEENYSLFGLELAPGQIDRLAGYYELFLKWNPRLHLVAPCSPDEFAVRHILESLLLLKHVPERARLADIGAGAGLPSIPCLLVREDLRAVLVESSPRKSAFLKEAVRAVPERAELIVSRFEAAPAPNVDFVTCRALDRFSSLLTAIIEWAPPSATFLFFAGEALAGQITQLLKVSSVELIPRSEKRFLLKAHAPKVN